MPGPVAAASAKRRTDPARRFRRGSVKSALLQNLPACISFPPQLSKAPQTKKAPACQALNRAACAECKRGGCTSPSFPHSSRGKKKKRGGGSGQGVDGGEGRERKKKPLMPRLGCSSCSGAAASEGGFSGLKWVCRIRLHARRSRERQRFLSVSRSEPSRASFN